MYLKLHFYHKKSTVNYKKSFFRILPILINVGQCSSVHENLHKNTTLKEFNLGDKRVNKLGKDRKKQKNNKK